MPPISPSAAIDQAEQFLRQLGSDPTPRPVDQLVADVDHHQAVLEEVRSRVRSQALGSRLESVSGHLGGVKAAALATGGASFSAVEVVRGLLGGGAGPAPTGTAAQAAGGTTPQTAGGATPQTAAGTTPQTAAGTTPQAAAGTTPQTAAGVTPPSAGTPPTTTPPGPTAPAPTSPAAPAPAPPSAAAPTAPTPAPPAAHPQPAAPQPSSPAGGAPGAPTSGPPSGGAPTGPPPPPAPTAGPAPTGGPTPPGPPAPTTGPTPPVPPGPPGWWKQVRRWGRRPIGIATAGLVLAAGVGIGIAAAAGGGGNNTNNPAPVVAAAAGYSCSGAQVTLFNNTNPAGVLNGGTSPEFSTNGAAYCVTRIQTYHWNNGLGAHPGSLGLTRVSGSGGVSQIGPDNAQSSSGQGNAPNVNWFVDVGTTHPAVINGTYRCVDSQPATWSQNGQSQGAGFCIVYAVPAVGGPASAKGAARRAGAVAATTTTVAPQTLTMGPISANFIQLQFATFYSVNPKEVAALPLKYAWKLSLQLVDPAGAPNPGEPGSGAGVDTGCTNNGVLTANSPGFVWHHPDAANSNPPGVYHCNHQLMGPSGHEGLISVTVSDGKWACTATYGGTNTGVGGPAACAPLGGPPPGHYTCQSPAVKLFDNTNAEGVRNGGAAPSFSTGGKAYCLTRIQTYHWNNGQGAGGGSLGLVQLSGAGVRVGPFPAQTSSGQGNAPNVNWFVNVGTTPPTVINGTYQCADSDPSTWSTNAQAQNLGFCIVYGEPAVKA